MKGLVFTLTTGVEGSHSLDSTNHVNVLYQVCPHRRIERHSIAVKDENLNLKKKHIKENGRKKKKETMIT